MFFLKYLLFLFTALMAVISISNVAVIRVKMRDNSIDTLFYKLMRVVGASVCLMFAIISGIFLCS